MNLRALHDDDAAVSPVIGVILMVAITVILAAVIATFVLGLGQQLTQTTPQASFGFNYDEAASGLDSFGNTGGDGLLTITHTSGSTMDAGRLSVIGSSITTGAKTWGDSNDYSDGSAVSAGSKLTIRANTDDTVRVTWLSESGENSATLNRWDGPAA